VNLARYIANAGIMHIITAPIIYSLIIPFVLLDLFVTAYQRICLEPLRDGVRGWHGRYAPIMPTAILTETLRNTGVKASAETGSITSP
jgi:hypothetical protein